MLDAKEYEWRIDQLCTEIKDLRKAEEERDELRKKNDELYRNLEYAKRTHGGDMILIEELTGERNSLRTMCDEFDDEVRKVCIGSCDQYPDCKSDKYICDHAGLRRVIEKYSEMSTDEDGACK